MNWPFILSYEELLKHNGVYCFSKSARYDSTETMVKPELCYLRQIAYLCTRLLVILYHTNCSDEEFIKKLK